jgi:hypothetical protein
MKFDSLFIAVGIVLGLWLYGLTKPLVHSDDIDWINTPKVTIKEGEKICYVFEVDHKNYEPHTHTITICRTPFGE